jgi:hypothetical protein
MWLRQIDTQGYGPARRLQRLEMPLTRWDGIRYYEEIVRIR